MIFLREIISEEEWMKCDEDVKSNLKRLHFVLNFIRVLYDRPMIVTSGFRSKEKHFQIYSKKNNERIQKGLDPIPVPVKSWHLYGAACDIYDEFGFLKKWCSDNLHVLEDLNVYCESFDATPGWCHFQIYSPKSGKRFFNP